MFRWTVNGERASLGRMFWIYTVGMWQAIAFGPFIWMLNKPAGVVSFAVGVAGWRLANRYERENGPMV